MNCVQQSIAKQITDLSSLLGSLRNFPRHDFNRGFNATQDRHQFLNFRFLM
jgi:hypothetical protein